MQRTAPPPANSLAMGGKGGERGRGRGEKYGRGGEGGRGKSMGGGGAEREEEKWE